MKTMRRILQISFLLVLAFLVLAGTAWAAVAFSFHLVGAAFWLACAVVGVAAVAALAVGGRSWVASWIIFLLAGAAVGGWYQTITPRQDRDWAVDVSRGVTARIAGDQVTLGNIRDFRWKNEKDAEAVWINRTYDLSKLSSVDVITSVWDSPDIAHLLVSFGFEDGEPIVFSVEIRREADEAFNEIGGFFRQFELVLVGATETDIVKLRTNYRKENVSLYPVELSAEDRRSMFMSFVELAQILEEKPLFYNTLTANCTTVVFRLARTLQPDLAIDWRVVMSGHLPSYLNDLGVLGGEGGLQAREISAKISERAQVIPEGANFSQWIRQR
ncbi:DUF4105 domain-containing protein [Roseibium sp.]|uniref:Lnb N-terminal periplasmic domain-containing protein n=1 Tax=Roseibium sp. TaxID=1936156 RepID=UPI003A978ED0